MNRRPFLFGTALAVVASAARGAGDSAAAIPVVTTDPHQVRHRTVDVDGVKIFYREAGDARAPVLVLLHGFPSSSHMFRDLIPRLSNQFRVIAPDYPGYGFSDAPARETYSYTFDRLARTMVAFLDKVGASSYVLYMHDFGGPIGLRIATGAPQRVNGLVVQNANAYEAGLSPALADARKLWAQRTAETEAPLRGAFSPDGIQWQYTQGARDAQTMPRDGYTFDIARMQRPGQDAIQLDLLADYGSNVSLYPQWQAWLKAAQPKTLVVWGNGDPFFTLEGANGIRRDVRASRIVIYRGGHFLLEEYAPQVAHEIVRMFGRSASRR